MLKIKQLESILEHAIDALISTKPIDLYSVDSFLFSNGEVKMNKTNKLKTNFQIALILGSTKYMDDIEKVKHFRRKIAKWLLNQGDKKNSCYNWWQKSVHGVKNYPNDADDTFFSWKALYEYSPKLINEKTTANLLDILFLIEKNPGGPYNTWIVPNNLKNWKDYDPVVNCNIATLLASLDVLLEKQEKFICDNIFKKNCSKYYKDELVIIYFFSKFFREVKEKDNTLLLARKKAIKKLNERCSQIKNLTPHQIALIISSMVIFKYHHPKIQVLLKKLLESFPNWGAGLICLDTKMKKEVRYAGSTSITLALGIEALFHGIEYYKSKHSEKKERFIVNSLIKEMSLENLIMKNELNKNLVVFRESSNFELALFLPFSFFETLTKEQQKKVGIPFVVALSKANVCGWIAYSIIDDFIDNKKTHAKVLPIALWYARKAIQIYSQLFPKKHKFHQYFSKILGKTDCMYLIEAMSKKNDKNGSINKSFGHFLCIFSILIKTGISLDSPLVEHLSKFCKHYFIIKQLNDDAHDWEEDLKQESHTFVTRWLVKKSKSKRLTILRKLFWKSGIEYIYATALKHINLARRELILCEQYLDSKLFIYLLEHMKKNLIQGYWNAKRISLFQIKTNTQ